VRSHLASPGDPDPGMRRVPRPLTGFAVVFLAGCLLAFHGSVPFALLCSLAGIALVLAWAGCRKENAGAAALWAACFLMGWASAQLQIAEWSPDHVRHRIPGLRTEVEVIGRIRYDPEQAESRVPGMERHVFPMHLEALVEDGTRIPVRGTIRVTASASPGQAPFLYGDRRQVRGVLVRHEADTSGFRPRFDGYLYADDGDAVLLERNRGRFWLGLCLRARRAGARELSRGIEAFPAHAALLRALLLGYRGDLPEEVIERFRITGTVHVLALSGLHVGFICILIAFALRILAVPRTQWFYVMAPLLLAYMLATGLRSSAVRACLMALCYWAAPAFRRRPDALTALSAAALLILFVDPTQAVSPGFQYSFIIVGALVMVLPVLHAWGERLLRLDPLRLPQEGGGGGGRALLHRRLRVLHALVSASFTAWLASFPLTMYYGNLLVPVALVGNLLVVPLTSLIVAVGAVSLLAAPLGALPVEAFNHANRVFISLLFWIVELLSAIPGGYVHVRSPAAWAVVLFYLSAGVCLWSRHRLRWVPLLLALLVLGAGSLPPRVREVSAQSFPLGRSDVELVRLPRGAPLLINTGSAFHARQLRRRLREEGVNSLQMLVLLHMDRDHAGGAVTVLDERRVQAVWLPAAPSYSPVYPELLAALQRRGVPVRTIAAGDVITLPCGAHVHVRAAGSDDGQRGRSAPALRLEILAGTRDD